MSSQDDTLGLFESVRAGDFAAYEALFLRFADRLLLYVRLRLGPELAALVEPWDVVQETFLQAHRDFARFAGRDPRTFGHWLNRIAANRIRDLADHFGSQKRRAPGPRADSQALDRIRASVTGPGTASEREERRRGLHQALTKLSQRQREAVFLRFFEGRSYGEIGAQLGFGRETARLEVTQAIALLGSVLRDLG